MTVETLEKRLRRCVFWEHRHLSGAPPFIMKDNDYLKPRPLFWVECGYCGARGPLASSADGAASGWNNARRVNP